MPGPFDNALKHLTELSPQDWVVQGGWPAAPASAIDSDIATLSGATDKVIRVTGQPDWLLSVEFQAGHDTAAKLPNLLLYNSALFKRHDLLVRSLLVVLHREADSPRLTGLYERGFPGEPFDVALRYRFVRVWQVPPAQWLAGGLGLLPLAPLGDVQAAELPAVIGQMKQRLAQETRIQAGELWSAVYLLMGLRYPDALIQTLLQGVTGMEESVTYQAIIRKGEAKGEAKGKAEEARRMLLLFGRDKLGEPPQDVQAALDALADVQRLEELAVRLKHVSNWHELLGKE
jgi:predicted transposase YdaD